MPRRCSAGNRRRRRRAPCRRARRRGRPAAGRGAGWGRRRRRARCFAAPRARTLSLGLGLLCLCVSHLRSASRPKLSSSRRARRKASLAFSRIDPPPVPMISRKRSSGSSRRLAASSIPASRSLPAITGPTPVISSIATRGAGRTGSVGRTGSGRVVPPPGLIGGCGTGRSKITSPEPMPVEKRGGRASSKSVLIWRSTARVMGLGVRASSLPDPSVTRRMTLPRVSSARVSSSSVIA